MPQPLKIFLLALAIIDDLGAIIVIAVFYGHGISTTPLLSAGAFLLLVMLINRLEVKNPAVYLILGVFMWVAVLKSGVHATIAGVMLGLLFPLKGNEARFHDLEHGLHAPVNFLILPLFAFVNTGIDFSRVTADDFTATVTMGIVLGLFLGKTAGIFLFSWLSVKLGIGRLPEGMGGRELLGVAMLGGIGFTMSLFIGGLAFECLGNACPSVADERIGILIGSVLAGISGYLYLNKVLTKK